MPSSGQSSSKTSLKRTSSKIIRKDENAEIASALKAYDDIRRQQKFIERVVSASAFLFVTAICLAVWYSDVDVFDGTMQALRSVEPDATASRQPDINCRDKRNQHTPYCLDRAEKIRSDWRGITRFQGKANPFALHER